MQTPEQLSAVFGGNAIFVVAAAFLSVCGIIVAVGAAIKTVKEWINPSSNRKSKLEKLEEYTKNDKARLDGHETRLQALENNMKDVQGGQRVMMRGLMALLDHELHNGNATQMQHASEEINQYLTDK